MEQFLINEFNEIYLSNIPNGVLKNSVGSGDSMVAGFIAGYLKQTIILRL